MVIKNFSDDQLLNALSQGNEEAMTEIYHRYWRKLIAVAYNRTKDKLDAEEIVQNVMIKLWDKRTDLQIKSLSGYLAGAVKYGVLNSIQRQGRRDEIAFYAIRDQTQDFSEQRIDAHFLNAYINTIIDKLPEKCKLVFKYSRHDGKNNAEIAKELEITEKTVEAHLTKAIKSIRFSLKNTGIVSLTILILLIRQ